jgi:endonuclease YncB( thermonuclease family)
VTTLQHIRKVITLLPVRVVDGDSWWCYVDQDFREIGYHEFRLDGWDTPEKQGPLVTPFEREKARQATEDVREWWAYAIDHDLTVYVKTKPDPEKYGRWLAGLWAEDEHEVETHLGPHLFTLGLAVPSRGTAGNRWRDTYRG